jgi:hypothetical protein
VANSPGGGSRGATAIAIFAPIAIVPVVDRVPDSGRCAKIEEHLSAALGMKNRVAQRGERIGCRDWHPDRAGRDERPQST